MLGAFVPVAYLRDHWKQNETGLLFLNRRGRLLKRSYVVKFGLKPILRKLGLRTERVGLHAFRHGLGDRSLRVEGQFGGGAEDPSPQ